MIVSKPISYRKLTVCGTTGEHKRLMVLIPLKLLVFRILDI
jgi:hypothetical protein